MTGNGRPIRKVDPPDKAKGRKIDSGKSDVDADHGGYSGACAGSGTGGKRALEDSHESDSSTDNVHATQNATSQIIVTKKVRTLSNSPLKNQIEIAEMDELESDSRSIATDDETDPTGIISDYCASPSYQRGEKPHHHSSGPSYNQKTKLTQYGKYVHRFYRVYATRRVISPISPCYLVRPGG